MRFFAKHGLDSSPIVTCRLWEQLIYGTHSPLKFLRETRFLPVGSPLGTLR